MSGRLTPRISWFLLALGIAGILQGGRRLADVPRGLRGGYYDNTDRAGMPSFFRVDDEPSTAQIRRTFSGVPPEQFSARWTGFLSIRQAGTYTFFLTSDDASALSIDGRDLIALPGRHESQTAAAPPMTLEPGLYPVAIDYTQYGGGYALAFEWSRDGSARAPVPSWLMAPRRLRPQSILAGRLIDIAANTATLVSVLLGVWLLGRRAWRDVRRSVDARRAVPGDAQVFEVAPRLSWRPKLLTLALFVSLAVVHTWPLAADPGHLSRSDNADTLLNEWTIAWVAHQLPRDPVHLFDANIFYPERDTLAYSESLVTQSIMGAPVLWLGGSPVLTYNLLVIAGFALTGWAMCLLMARWTGSWTAAIVAGGIYGFNAHTLTRIPHIQALHVEFLPAALFALDSMLRVPRIRAAISLATWFVLQALTSVHLFVFSAFALAAALVVRPEAWRAPRTRPLAIALVVAAVVAGAMMLPFLLPYLRASHSQGFERPISVVTGYEASWRDYLSTPARLHYSLWSAPFFVGTALFPGALGLLLAAVSIATGQAISHPRARLFLAIAAIGVALSFGPALPGYNLLHTLLPPLRAIRAVVRFGYLGIVGVAGLAGFGVLAIRQWTPARWWPAVATALMLTASFESFAAPLGVRRFDRIPEIYATLANDDRAVIVEVPFFDARNASLHAAYMLNSTRHWRPILNGYSGFQPGSFYEHADALRSFPDASSIAALRRSGVTHVFAHVDQLPPPRLAILRSTPELTRLAAEGSIELYQVAADR